MSTTPKAPKGFIILTTRDDLKRYAVASIRAYHSGYKGDGSWVNYGLEDEDHVTETPEQIDALIAEAQGQNLEVIGSPVAWEVIGPGKSVAKSDFAEAVTLRDKLNEGYSSTTPGKFPFTINALFRHPFVPQTAEAQ